MPKPPKFPTLFDNVLQLSIKDLKRLGMLKPEMLLPNTLTWEWRHGKKASIFIWVSTLSPKPYLELCYTIKEKKFNYKVDLVQVPSNLGVGMLWFFVCPITGKRCRKLYFAQGYFLHRAAFPQGMYSCQKKSKSVGFYDVLQTHHKIDKLNAEMEKKYFKSHYAGKPTKRYTQLLKKLDSCQKTIDRFPDQEFIREQFFIH